MKSNIKLFMAALGVAGVVSISPATAGTYTLADLTTANQADFFGSNFASGGFNATYSFALDVGSSDTISVVTSSSASTITSLTLSLFQGASLLLSQTFTPADFTTGSAAYAGGVLETLANLAPGSYSLGVSGTTIAGGAYSGTVSISPVPIPAAALLFGSGLLGLGVVGRRRKTTVVSA